MKVQTCVGFALVAILLAPPSSGAQLHSEVVVAVDPNGRLVASAGPAQPLQLPPSRIAGIDGYAGPVLGFRSLDPSEQTAALRPLDPDAHVAFELVYADPGLTILGNGGSAPMRRGDLFKLGTPPFETHPVWILAADVHQPSKVTVRLRDRAVIHDIGPVISFVFVPDPAIEAYLCPLRCEGQKAYDAPGRCPRCGTPLKLATTARYAASVTPDQPPRAGIATKLKIALRDPSGAPVKELEAVDERLLEVFLTSADLSWFAHERPVRNADGTFTLPVTFPAAGIYTLFHDFTPVRVGMQVVSSEVAVAGPSPERVPLEVDGARVKPIDGYTVSLQTGAPLVPLHEATLTFSLARDGAPVRDLEPFLGALGHLAVASQERTYFMSSPARETAGATGPDITFRQVFPAAGVYRVWGQFQRQGAILTVPFTLRVEQADSPRLRKPPAPSDDADSEVPADEDDGE